jgi:Flp pilus assembly pilin Flp
MFDTVRVLVTMWTQRWQALREDEGATAIEYAVIVAVGFAMATAVALVVHNVVTDRTKGIS